jgi:hypothetical protein
MGSGRGLSSAGVSQANIKTERTNNRVKILIWGALRLKIIGQAALEVSDGPHYWTITNF